MKCSICHLKLLAKFISDLVWKTIMYTKIKVTKEIVSLVSYFLYFAGILQNRESKKTLLLRVESSKKIK